VTYAEAVARVQALRGGEHTGMRAGLARIEALLAALGNPERRYTLVQVGGTNGKGSVSVMLAAMLRAAGRRVGLYTSPHLVSFRERIRVNGEAITEDRVVDGVEALGTLVARLDASMFEATTALALDHFAAEGVDVAVLEVGLGGRLDATTVGRPAVCVITSIDLDHQAVLGPTLAHIAAEKAAIIRSGLAVVAEQEAEVADIIAARAAHVGVPLLRQGRELAVRVVRRGLDGQRIACDGPGWSLGDVELALLGEFQPANALLALAAARQLGVPEAALRAGLRRVRWPGRFQIVGRHPWVVLDGAHNVGGARVLAASLRGYFGGERITLIVGISDDKDAATMLAVLAPLASRLIVTAASNRRAMAPASLAAKLPSSVAAVETAPSAAEALAMALGSSRPDVVCVAGSLFLVADALRHLGAGDTPCSVENDADSMEVLL
jgi:dihydrofolate synthase/folylpolyglutamate synthase